MNARRVVSVFVMLACAAQAALALAQSSGAARPAVGASAPAATAIVGAKRILTTDVDQRTTVALAELSRRSGNAPLSGAMRMAVRRQVLEAMIRQELLALEARRLGVAVPASEAEAALKRESYFNPGGRFDEQRFLAAKTTQRPQYDAAIAAIQGQLATRKLGDQLIKQFAPNEAVTRQRAARSLARVTLDHFSLLRGDFDGAAPEPREADVHGWYRAHAENYRRTDRAVLTVAFVNTPGLSDAQRKVPGAMESWNRRMKNVADSLLAEVARGGDFEAVTSYLSPRAGIVVASDNFPGYWRGTAAQERQVFDPGKQGTVIPEAIPGQEGWLLVKVTSVQPAHLAPLAEVSRDIRRALRRERKAAAQEEALRRAYARFADSLAAPGWRVRWVVFDAATMAVPEPTPAELDRHYRGHLADYSSFDPASGTIVARPFSAVSADVRAGYLRDARVREARLAADQTQRAWAARKRDAVAEGKGKLSEVSAPAGADFDSTRWGRLLADSIWAHDPPRGGAVRFEGAWLVWQPIEPVQRIAPTFAQLRGWLLEAWKQEKASADTAGARRLFAADPWQFARGLVVHYSRVVVTPPPVLQIPLTRAEVEAHHRENIGDYSAQELVRASHILVEPKTRTPEGEAAARQLAEGLLARAQSGEDFAALAREYSDDVATKQNGGDLGTFGRGSMLQPIEDAAFARQAGELVPGVVHTEVGYHVVQVVEHVPAVVQPLDWLYAAVASDAAYAKGERLARATADSMLRLAKRPADIVRMASQKGYLLYSDVHKIGEPVTSPEVEPFFRVLEGMRPGSVYPASYSVKGQGHWLAWVDSLAPRRMPSWEEARPRALEAYRREAGDRAMAAKQQELDSLLVAGWSVDSLAALWGGAERTRDLAIGTGVPVLGSIELADSVVFGTDRTPALPAGKWTGWVSFPNTISRLRVVDRAAPSSILLAEREAQIRNAEAETAMRAWFDDAKKRWPVRILDPQLRDLAPLSPGTSSTPKY